MATDPAQSRVARPVELIVWVEAESDDQAYDLVAALFPGADGTGDPVINGRPVQYVTLLGSAEGIDPMPLR